MSSAPLNRKRNIDTVSCQKIFPVKLLEFLNLEKHNDVIGWDIDLCTILIINIKKLPSLLVKYNILKTTNLDSIKKQFNLYGFTIINRNKIVHPIFRKYIPIQELNCIKRNMKYEKIKSENIIHSNFSINKSIFEENIEENIEQFRKKLKVNVKGKSIEYCLDAVSSEVDELENSDDIFDIEFLQNIKINELIGNNIFRLNKSDIIMEEFDNYVNDWELFEQFSDYEISYNDICKFIK